MRLRNFCDADEENHNSSSRRKIHIEPTLPIYLSVRKIIHTLVIFVTFVVRENIILQFQDVKYKTTVKGPLERQSDSERCILHGVTGSVRPGEVLALMGPSGGGKTTLLNLLSGRVKLKSGTITYNDQPYGKSLKQRIGFVLQDDIVFSHLTVKETLTYAALLRLPNSLTREQKKERAMNVLTELGLERCQDTVIGGAFVRGISGGERKRLCIGNEILLNPSLLFLDEPTSGLDSTTALRIVQMLHSIAEAGKTVVTTIHQPSSTIFSKFDKLILLGKGSSLYFGKASEVMVYFSSIGCSPLIAMNPAEFLIDLANGNMKDKSVPSELEDKFLPQSPKKLEPKYAGPSPLDVHEYLVGAHEARLTSTDKAKVLKPMLIEVETRMQSWANSREWGATWWQQFSILFLRGLKERRHEYFSSVRVTQVISTAIIVGLLWWHSDTSTPKRLQDQARLLFFVSVFWAFFPILTAIFTFPQERAMLVKERSVDMYRLSAYLVARNISDLPLDLTLPIVFLVIVYFMAGLKLSFTAFSLTLFTVLLSIVASQGLGLTIGAAFMDVKKATTLASIIVMAFMLSGGFFIQEVPSFMSWVRYVSINYHTYRLLLKIQYGCSGSGSGSCEPPFIRGQILGWGGIEVASMLVMIVGYRILAYFFLRRMKLRTLA
ncbi:ABC transporter G family member 22-like isoform X1 [Actinidia eriantha]|uniref:ABC transporter G family member 22-like isoform X1 n=1 Tax=Actinidia eriantha TaxID=165200 RepID=UPI002588FB5B|nr:ABC transporter G family member 22-like isoform X1 [Actinidia eriantha]